MTSVSPCSQEQMVVPFTEKKSLLEDNSGVRHADLGAPVRAPARQLAKQMWSSEEKSGQRHTHLGDSSKSRWK